ncbi:MULTISPECIES: hypothetical protein [unclassified Sphingomonas]|uniref:hypothetical protein n=1 Tax=unclassified Sphingomonas TaxID=196159 RepID=UPI00285C4A58|nr:MULTISPECIES: hypothetical protein [unclassified Sphingomonas]MDR6114995.1 hypothetical protein [Sphingomonas sp. SORGH_AS_0789]MDR6151331.1 hypothetical protein [Sphingomonas sp. SORGH_AS_0742]
MSLEHQPRLLDEQTAFRAMCVYLEAYWERGLRSSDDIAQLLSIVHNDPATPDDWANAIEQVVR